MSTELKVPSVGESIASVVVSQWMFEPGQKVAKDAVVVVLETDKINVEVSAPTAGTLTEVIKKTGDTAAIGDTLGMFEEGEGPDKEPSQSKPEPTKSKPVAPQAAPAAPPASPKPASPPPDTHALREPLPAARRLLEQNKIEANDVKGSGKDGQVIKEDVQHHLVKPPVATGPTLSTDASKLSGGRQEEAVPMGPLRKTIAKRLLEAQHSAALLTTFNEVDMSAVMELRSAFQTEFQARHGGKLGFMSFFVKAAIEALKAFPAVNAEIRDDHVIYHNYYDIGVAVGGGKGLVVPVLRNAERLSFSGIEKQIKEYAERAQAGKLKLEELQGGTFTISNGGVYGSMLSTPIVNPPQSGVLGLHKIMDRPMAVKGQVVIRPMMYLALTYDHRLVDGREAVSFLIRIKDCIENPTRILLEV